MSFRLKVLRRKWIRKGKTQQIMKENQNIEWKESWHDDYLKWICGFANAQGGRLVIGKDDRGKAVSLPDAKKLLEDLPNRIRDLLGIMVDVNLKSSRGKDYLEIDVEPYPAPVSYRGRYYFRSGSTKQELKGAALDKFLLRKQGKHWDGVPVPYVSVKDLSKEALAAFRKRATESKRMQASDLTGSDAVLIDRLKLMEGKYLKNAAVLLFHPDSERFVTGAFIKIGFFRTDSDLRFQDEVHGDLFTQVSKALDFLLTKYTEATISYRGVQRVESYPVPEDALREALHNAVVHKDYSSGTPIQIRVYTDKISIWNPGELPIDWTVERLLKKHASYPFNPDIANAFFRAGMIEAWGRGIEMIMDSCSAAGLPEPEIRCDHADMWVEFPFAPVKTPEKSSGKRRERFLMHVGEMAPLLSLNFPELAILIGVTERSIQRNIQKLQTAGLLERVGGRKEGHWKIIEEGTANERV